MKVPPKRKGNYGVDSVLVNLPGALNESPSEKEGKLICWSVPPGLTATALNESPSEKEGKCRLRRLPQAQAFALNESPSEKEGKWAVTLRRTPRASLPQ